MEVISGLNDTNQAQISKYLKYFRQKRESSIKLVNAEIKDVKNDRLNEDVYSKDDVEDVLDFLNSALRVISINLTYIVFFF